MRGSEHSCKHFDLSDVRFYYNAQKLSHKFSLGSSPLFGSEMNLSEVLMEPVKKQPCCVYVFKQET